MSRPPRSGMLMSRISRSKRAPRSMSSVCEPLEASAMDAKRPFCCKYCRSPARTNAWSSAIRTLVMSRTPLPDSPGAMPGILAQPACVAWQHRTPAYVGGVLRGQSGATSYRRSRRPPTPGPSRSDDTEYRGSPPASKPGPRDRRNKENQMRSYRNLAALALGGLLSMGLAACEDKGPVEQAAEEVDEAIDTVGRGEESTANKVDDAVDELRD